MRGGRVAIAAVSVVLLGLVFANSALACSCAPSTPSESLADSDAALAGRLLSVASRGAARAEYRYEVLHVYRGRDKIKPGTTLSVISSRSSDACALPGRIAHNYGLFLLGDGQRWTGGLCGVVSPRRLWAAAGKPGGGRATGSVASCAS
ncbi:MAG TPA: hypothetical protein VH275_01270 [Solirubrobacterales bacterium]|nr:hypothetical protein [Solirubrobacterales bacterium]